MSNALPQRQAAAHGQPTPDPHNSAPLRGTPTTQNDAVDEREDGDARLGSSAVRWPPWFTHKMAFHKVLSVPPMAYRAVDTGSD